MALHSLVIPIFNEEENVHELYRRLHQDLLMPIRNRGDDYELVFVDDGSMDRSFQLLKELHEKDQKSIVIIRFSRNFGHQMAITAGLDRARGDTVTVLDADLQDPPSIVLEMIQKWELSFDIVYAVRKKRLQEGLFKRLSANFFYRILAYSTRLDIPKDVGDFRLMSRRTVDALRGLRERHRFMRGMAKWIGFKQTYVSYVREGRFAGTTKYPFQKMLRLAWDAFTGFSLLPLRAATFLGLSSAVVSFLVALWALYIRFFTDQAIQGWTSTIIIVLFLGGVQLFCIGVLGEYVGRIFEQVKNRPLYIIEEIVAPIK